IPRLKPLLTTARIAAFIPGASPPLVKTPIVLISLFAVIFLLHILAALCFDFHTSNRSYFIAFSRYFQYSFLQLLHCPFRTFRTDCREVPDLSLHFLMVPAFLLPWESGYRLPPHPFRLSL